VLSALLVTALIVESLVLRKQRRRSGRAD